MSATHEFADLIGLTPLDLYYIFYQGLEVAADVVGLSNVGCEATGESLRSDLVQRRRGNGGGSVRAPVREWTCGLL